MNIHNSNTNTNDFIKNWWEMEFIGNIFQFTNIEQNVTSLSLVCKRWNDECNNPLLWKTLVLRTSTVNDLYETNLNRWRNIELLDIYIGLDVDPFLAFHVLNRLENECKCRSIKSLAVHIFGFDGASIIDNTLFTLKSLICKNKETLENLKVEYGRGLTKQIFPDVIFTNLNHLTLDRIGHSQNLLPHSNLSFAKWPRRFPNITSLSINYAELSFEDFMDIAIHCNKLKYLSIFMLEHEWMTREKVAEILTLFPNLIGLQLEYPRFERSPAFFIDVAISCPKIEVLYFWWWSVSDEDYDMILKSFGNLKQLGFAYSSISNNFIETHPLTHKLKKLGLYGTLLSAKDVSQKYKKDAEQIAKLFK